MKFASSFSERQRHCIAWFITAVVHGWILYLLLHHRQFIVMRGQTERHSVLWILSESQPTSVRIAHPTPSSAAPQQKKKPVAHSTSSSSAQSVLAPAAITFQPQQSEPIEKPKIDWEAAASLSAKELAQKLDAPPEQRALDGSDKKQPAKPKKKSEFEWKPEIKRFSLTPEGLPRIRLSRRCVYMPPYIVGCGFGGDSPPPNRDLFNGMHDPDEERSSVPDIQQKR